MFDSPEAAFAIDAVRQASKLVSTVQKELITPALTKDDRSPVTVADFAAQALVGELLAQAFPEATLVGEENATDLRLPERADALARVAEFVGRFVTGATPDLVCDWIDRGCAEPGQRYWTLDPVDGTKGFLRGEQYAVALALVDDGNVTLGVLGCPNLSDGYQAAVGGSGSLVVAQAGVGTWTAPLAVDGEFRQLHVSERTVAADARLLRSVESGHTNVGQIGELVAALATTAEPVLMDSQAKYAVLAAGAGDLLFRLLSPSKPDYREKIWDQAAGSLVIQEAGGRITDLDGKRLDFTQGRTLAQNRGVVASNGHLHDSALEALRRIGA